LSRTLANTRRDGIMNETRVAVSRNTSTHRLPLFRFNRRFVICCALCAASLQLALAEMSPPRRLPSSFPAQLTKSTPPPTARKPDISEWDAWRAVKTPRHNDPHARRDRFEADFGIDGKRQSGLLGSLQFAKYAVDDATFTLDDFSRTLSDSMRLEFDNGHLHRVPTLDQNSQRLPGPWSAMPHGVRFSPELNLASGKPYIGVYVVVPLGN